MTETVAFSRELARRVHDLVTQYVNKRTEIKSGIRWEEFKDKWVTDPESGRRRRDVPDRYREARERVCEDAFLSMRSCRSREDFVAYFTGTLCSVPQYLPEEDYFLVAEALLVDNQTWEDVKALAMLTVSSASRI